MCLRTKVTVIDPHPQPHTDFNGLAQLSCRAAEHFIVEDTGKEKGKDKGEGKGKDGKDVKEGKGKDGKGKDGKGKEGKSKNGKGKDGKGKSKDHLINKCVPLHVSASEASRLKQVRICDPVRVFHRELLAQDRKKKEDNQAEAVQEEAFGWILLHGCCLQIGHRAKAQLLYWIV